MSNRAVLYARVSGDDRANEGRNLAGQLEMGRQYAAENGYTVVGEIAEDIRGASGASLDLEGVDRALQMAETGQYDVLVVREIDRFARFAVKWLILEEQLKLYGVAVEYVLEEYPNTPEGDMMKTFKAAVAEYEAKKIAERMKRGRRQVVKSGRVLLHGNRSPYGYCSSEDGRNLAVYEPEAKIVRLIFSWHTEGDETGRRLSMRKIAAKPHRCVGFQRSSRAVRSPI